MDEYYLTKEDWETVVELGVGARNGDDVMKKIPSAVKSSFTRKWVFQVLVLVAQFELHNALRFAMLCASRCFAFITLALWKPSADDVTLG